MSNDKNIPSGVYFDAAHIGYVIHMLFFCLGGILWYALFYRIRVVPRVISVLGLAAICLVFINILILLYDPGAGNIILLLAPYAPFELVLGLWLILKGFNSEAIVSEPPRTAMA